MRGYNCFTDTSDKIKHRSKSRKDTPPKTLSRKMVKWWYGTGLTSSQDNQRRQQQQQQQQQFDTDARIGSAQSVNPPSYESVTHQVNATGGIQINHTEKDTQVITGSQHAYAESVPESSVTEDFEKDDVATEDSGWDTEDTDNAISKRKESEQKREKAAEKGASRPSPESTHRQLKTSVGIQNNNAGNGEQYNTFASQGNVYNFNSGGGRQFQHAEFHGDLRFGPDNEKINVTSNNRGNGQSSYVVQN